MMQSFATWHVDMPLRPRGDKLSSVGLLARAAPGSGPWRAAQEPPGLVLRAGSSPLCRLADSSTLPRPYHHMEEYTQSKAPRRRRCSTVGLLPLFHKQGVVQPCPAPSGACAAACSRSVPRNVPRTVARCPHLAPQGVMASDISLDQVSRW